MPTAPERKCCWDEKFVRDTFDLTVSGTRCVCDSEEIKQVINAISCRLLWVASQRYSGGSLDTSLMKDNNYRHFAYKNYITCIHGYLGKGRRIPVPSCVVLAIRRLYPDPGQMYRGFLLSPEPQQSEADDVEGVVQALMLEAV